ncbi:SRPBCC family protein [Sciscionella marina]|uniref:SRPBCC family protein n=1 Tax=Sciscionella marina TaxID=508770 RepID=UPI00035ECD02|nr:SRPBCC family protein [Sciscionella marina]
MTGRTVTASRTVAAKPEDIFALLTDPARHSEIDGSGMVLRARGAAQRLRLGAKFGMDMRMFGVPYRISNTVVEFEEGRCIAWRHFAGHRWRWELAPNEDGTTLVTETFDYSTTPVGRLYPLAGFPEQNRKAIEASLDRLAARFTSP